MTFDYQGIFGYDISTYQDSPDIPGTVDFAQMAASGARFCVFRASIGNAADADFATYWQNSRGHLLTAAYHYYLMNPSYPPKTQAARFWNTIKADPPYRVFLDCEEGVAGDWRKWYDFLEEFKRLSGFTSERIGIYTGYYVWTSVLADATTAQREYFKQYLLWLAWYFPDPFHPIYTSILTPRPWAQYELLQSGTPAIGSVAGVESKEIDYDQLNGGEAKLYQIFGGGVVPPIPPPTGGSMKYGALNATTSVLNVRSAANASASIVTQINRGDLVTGNLDTVSNWLNVKTIKRNDGTKAAVNLFCNAGYLSLDELPVTAPPTAQTRTVAVDESGWTPTTFTQTKS